MEINKAVDLLDNLIGMVEDNQENDYDDAFHMAIDALKAQADGDTISRKAVLNTVNATRKRCDTNSLDDYHALLTEAVENLPSAQPDLGKYEYHYDHTDCIWYRPEARNRCPVTCAQYRDGWNDAMNYIFRDGKGYRPYRRGEQYEE